MNELLKENLIDGAALVDLTIDYMKELIKPLGVQYCTRQTAEANEDGKRRRIPSQREPRTSCQLKWKIRF